MPKKQEYEHKGRLDIYGPKPPKDDNDWIWGVAFAVLVIFLISSCS